MESDAAARRRARRTRLWFPILVVSGSLAVSFVGAEIVLRVAGISYPIFFEPHPITGGRMRPGPRGWWTQEGHAWIEVGERGYRGPDPELGAHPERFRFAVLGDSYVAALQLPYEDSFWQVAERALRGCPALAGREPEAISFGISGLGTAQALRALRHEVWGYEPDFVMLAFVTNDVQNSYRKLQKTELPYYVLQEDGSLELDDRFLQRIPFEGWRAFVAEARRTAGDHSRVLQLVNELRRVANRLEQQAAEPPRDGPGVLRPDTPEWQEAWRTTEALVAQIAREVGERERPFLLVSVTTEMQVHPDPVARAEYDEKFAGADFLYPNKRLAALAEREGISYLSLAEPMRAWAEANQTCVHGFENQVPCGGHWNEAGHALAGRLVAERICAELTRSHRTVESTSTE